MGFRNLLFMDRGKFQKTGAFYQSVEKCPETSH
jgi:hypothetical protein